MARGKKRSAKRGRKTAAPVPPPAPPLSPLRTLRSRRWMIVAVLAGLIVVSGVVVMLTMRGGQPTTTTIVTAIDARAPAPDATPDASTKLSGPANDYVGSARCAECHEKEHAAWKRSWHAKALAPGVKGAVVGNFANQHFKGTSSEAWMKHAGTKAVMQTQGPSGALADYAVDWVIGGKRMQDAVTVFPDGRWQVLPIYFHVTKRAWVDYTETKQGALTPGHPFYWTNWRRMANHECLDCHTTALRVTYDDASAAWRTTFVDGSVACEDCHGAGMRHAETQEAADIVHPTHAGDVGLSACARCHGPRKPLFPLLDSEHQFQLGQSYDELYEPIVVTMGGGLSPEFFVDGRPKTSSFEYQAMIQSACYRKGGATCLTCHDAPHAAKGHAELRDRDPDAPCVKCHSSIDRVAHSHHKPGAAQNCITCHMAPVVSGVLDHFADHTIDVPVPQTTAKHGVPNACGVCHSDRSAAVLATQLVAWWPDAGKRQARRIRLADAIDDADLRATARPLAGVIGDVDEAPTLRGAAMILAARRFGPDTARAIKPFLTNPNVILRAKACEALALAKAKDAGDDLVARLDDSSLRVRLAAALALHDLDDPRGEAALAKLANDPVSRNLLYPHLEVGLAYARRNELAKAEAELTQVVRLSPYFVDAIVQLGAVLLGEGKLDEASRRVNQALVLEPQNAGALELRRQLAAKPH